MGNGIYGVDPMQAVTPIIVRDALVECFVQAHCLDAGISTEDKIVSASYCKEIVSQAFAETGGDFDHPTKQTILAAVGWLREFSKSFRDPSIIEKHGAEIMTLVGRLTE